MLALIMLLGRLEIYPVLLLLGGAAVDATTARVPGRCAAVAGDGDIVSST